MSVVATTEGAKIVREGLDHDFGGLVVMAGKSLGQLFDVHGHGLLEKLNIAWLTNGDEHAAESLQRQLSNRLGVAIGHVG